MGTAFSTLIWLCDIAIPPDEILNKGLGGLITDSKSVEVEALINKFIEKHEFILSYIKSHILNKDANKDITFSIAVEILTRSHGIELISSFVKEFSSFSAQIYFSNPTVLDSYSLIASQEKIKEILNSDMDYSIFSLLKSND